VIGTELWLYAIMAIAHMQSSLAVATVASVLQSSEGTFCKSKAVHEDSGLGRPKDFIFCGDWRMERKPSKNQTYYYTYSQHNALWSISFV